MRARTLLLNLLWGAVLLALMSVNTFAQDAPEASTANIQALISQLGDPSYLSRQRAESQLLDLGMVAFPQLQGATENADLEISSRAKYLLSQIRIEWTRPSDSSAVRAIMTRYGDLSPEFRKQKILQLAQLNDEEGFGALCRIARFDVSPEVTRAAALVTLASGWLPAERTDAAVAMLTNEMGDGQQAPISWIRTYANQLQSPKQFDPNWLVLIDEEIATLVSETGKTDESLTVGLLNSCLEMSGHLADAESIVAIIQRQIEFTSGDDTADFPYIKAVQWLIDKEQWQALELFEQVYADTIRSLRTVAYQLAWARQLQGRADEAESMAASALQQEGDDYSARNRAAAYTVKIGRHDWAEREWNVVIEGTAASDFESLDARNNLAMYRLHDNLQHKAAADLLTESIDAINGDPQLRRQLRNRMWRDEFVQAQANRAFLLACHCETIAAFDEQREHLEQAFRLQSDNADILIAMYRTQDADDAYREQTSERIEQAKQKLEKTIQQLSAERREIEGLQGFLAHYYNHWAWLVSNTEGDFDKAVEYSLKSLELMPEEPSYLDTLGRCYYAAGDLDKAIAAQREAVAKHPHMNVMQRQLKQFEEELQSRKDQSQE